MYFKVFILFFAGQLVYASEGHKTDRFLKQDFCLTDPSIYRTPYDGHQRLRNRLELFANDTRCVVINPAYLSGSQLGIIDLEKQAVTATMSIQVGQSHFDCALQPENQLLAMVDQSTLQVIDLEKQRTVLLGSFDCGRVAWGNQEAKKLVPDGQPLFVSKKDNIAQLIDATTGTLVKTYSGKKSSRPDVMFLPIKIHNDRLICGSTDGSIQIFDIATGDLITILIHEQQSFVADLVLSPNGKNLLVDELSGINLWHLDEGSMVKQIDMPEKTLCCDGTADSSQFLLSTPDSVYCYEADTGEQKYDPLKLQGYQKGTKDQKMMLIGMVSSKKTDDFFVQLVPKSQWQYDYLTEIQKYGCSEVK